MIPLPRFQRPGRFWWLWLAPLAVAARAGDVSAGEARESLARRVPAEVELFIEGRRVGDLLLPLTEPQAWLALAELAGQPASVDETDQWRGRIRETIGMEPADAVRTLLAEQFAFVAEGLWRAQDGVLLCRPATDAQTLRERWQPQPTAGRTSLYLLPNRVGVAAPEGLLVFGDAAPRAGMFQRMVDFLDAPDAARLADDPLYQRLLARVPEHPDAVLFARLPTRPVPAAATRPVITPETDTPPTIAPETESQPATPPETTTPAATAPADAPDEQAATPGAIQLPGPLRGAGNILLALHRQDGRLRFSAVGDGPVRRRVAATAVAPLVARLPERTLFAWGLHLEHAALLRAVEAMPPRSLLRLVVQINESSGNIERLVGALDPATCLAVGTVEPPTRAPGAPPLPAVACLIAVKSPEAASVEFGAFVEVTSSFFNLLALRLGGHAVPSIEPHAVADVTAFRLDLSGLIQGQPGAGAVGEVHLCWAVDGDVLIVASHSAWLGEVIAARRGAARPSVSESFPPSPLDAQCETVFFARAAAVAELGARWLAYLETAAPEVLSEDWWRARQPGGGRMRLGIQVTELPDERRLRVTAVGRDVPAAGALREGDEIIGCDGQRFATSQPVRELRTAMVNRPHARWLDLLVQRDGNTLSRRVPLPFVDPVQWLRRLVALGRLAERVTYYDHVLEEAGARGFLTIELSAPVVPPPEPPASEPATAPAGGWSPVPR